jgi:Ca-activated chloride channel homolog
MPVCLLFISAMLLLRPQAPASQERREVLSVDVELVNVTATVIDGSGRSVQGLTAQDFQVLEDGREQKISFFSHDSRVPISLGVLLDISGSLQDKLRQGLQTVREIASTLSADDEMFVVMFNSRVEVRQKFTSNPEEIQRSLGDIHAKGETAVYDAISVGLREMQAAKNQKQILLLVTDGFDTKSKINADQVQDLLKRSRILLYAIGIDDDDNNPPRGRAKYHIYDYMLGKLTDAGGGRVMRLYTGRNYDLRQLSEVFVGELHQTYTMGYYRSTAAENASWRNIEVRVTKPGVRIVGDKDRRHKPTILGRDSDR